MWKQMVIENKVAAVVDVKRRKSAEVVALEWVVTATMAARCNADSGDSRYSLVEW